MKSAPVIVVHGGAGDWSEGAEEATRACVEAAEAGIETLAQGSSLEAVLAAVRVLEDAPACNAGRGAVLTSDRTTELDACVMDGFTLSSGAVASLPPFRHPIDVARSVLDDGRYHLLVGEGAIRFALERGFERDGSAETIAPPHGAAPDLRVNRAGNTVGAVALDTHGRLAAATSTGGIAGRHPGRVGDSPIVGAGTYANRLAACSCTGDGEAFARACAAFWAVENAGEQPQRAATLLLDRVRDEFRGTGGVIIVNRAGEVGAARSMPLMPHAVARLDAPVSTAV